MKFLSKLFNDEKKNPVQTVKMQYLPLNTVRENGNIEDSVKSQVAFIDVDYIYAPAINNAIDKANNNIASNNIVGNSEIKAIVLNIESAGGAIDGVYNSAEKIKNSKIPVYAYINEVAFSAAYILAAAAKKVFLASPTAMVGGVGVVMEHSNISKMYEQMGIEITEIAAEKYKRIYSNYEALSDEGRKELQSKVDYVKDIFAAQVKANRGIDSIYESKIFVGQQAIEKGLADEILNFEGLIKFLENALMVEKTEVLAPATVPAEVISQPAVVEASSKPEVVAKVNSDALVGKVRLDAYEAAILRTLKAIKLVK